MKTLTSTYSIRASLDKVKISIYGGVNIEGVYIQDAHNDTLVYVGELKSNVFSFGKALFGTFDFKSLTLENPVLQVKINKSGKENNWSQVINMLSSPRVTSKKEKQTFLVSNLKIHHGKINVISEHKPNSKPLIFYDINADFQELRYRDTVSSIATNHLSFKLDSLKVNKFQGIVTKTPSRYDFKNAVLKTDNSEVKGNFSCDATFDENSQFQLDIKESKIDIRDISPFVSVVFPKKIAYIRLSARGSLNDISFDKVSIETKSSFLESNVKLHNLFLGLDQMTLQSKIVRSNLDVNEVVELLQVFGKSSFHFPKAVQEFGLQGVVNIEKSNALIKLNVFTPILNANIEASLLNIYDYKRFTYKGLGTVSNIVWDKLPEHADWKDSKIKLSFDGMGLNKDSLSMDFNADLENLKYKSHTYSNVELSGHIRNGILNTKLKKEGKNIAFDSALLYDFRKKSNALNFYVDVHRVALDKIFDYFEESSLMIGKVDLTLNIDSKEKLWGALDVQNLSYKARDSVFEFKNFKVYMDTDKTQKFFEINSPDFVSGQIQGNLEYAQFVPIIKRTLMNIYKSQAGYAQKKATARNVSFSLNIHSPFFKAFMPKLSVSENTKISGRLTSNGEDMYLDFDSSFVKFYDTKVYNPHIKIDNRLNNSISFNIKKVKNKIYSIEDMRTFNYFKNDTLFFKTTFKGNKAYKDYYDLNYYFTINKQKKYVLGMKSSTLRFNRNNWTINRSNNWKNKVEINESLDSLHFKSLVLEHRYEKVSVDGLFLKNKTTAKIAIKHINLSHILPDNKSFTLDGLLNFNLILDQNEKARNSHLNMSVSQLKVNNYLIGNLLAVGKSNNELFFLKSQLDDNDGRQLMNLRGFITRKLDLNLNTKLNRFDVGFLDFSNKIVSKIHGIVSGKLNIKGSLKKPKFSGYMTLYDAGLTLPYNKINYLAEDGSKVIIDSQNFYFKDILVYENVFNTKSRLDGYIQHNNFTNWYYNLKLDSKGEPILFSNTMDSDNDYFYGTCLAVGEASLLGYEEDLKLNINLDLRQGTEITIPIKDKAESMDDSFVKIKSKNQKQKKETIRLIPITHKGMNVLINLNVTPQAVVNVLFEGVSKLKIISKGSGKLTIGVNTHGDFHIWGNYTVSQGRFDLYYLGLISRSFSFAPGGSVTWNGNLFQGNLLNLRGIYSLEVDPDTLSSDLRLNQNIRTNVVMILNGNILHPQTKFEIDFPNTASYLKSYMDFYMNDEQEIQTQALSLITRSAFLKKGSLGTDIGSSNFNESASNLINSILKDSSSKINMGVSYKFVNRQDNLISSNSIYEQNRLGFNLRSNISDRVKFNGKVGVPTRGVQKNPIAGEGELEVLLNEEGSLSAKVFNRISDFQDFSNQQQSYTKGVGLYYKVDFNNFKELISKIWGRNKMNILKEEHSPNL